MWSLVGFAICDKRILTIMHSRRLRLLFTHHNEANGSQKKTNKDQKTNKDDRNENRQETEEREDQKKTNGDTYEKKRKRVGSKGIRLKNKSGWGREGYFFFSFFLPSFLSFFLSFFSFFLSFLSFFLYFFLSFFPCFFLSFLS